MVVGADRNQWIQMVNHNSKNIFICHKKIAALRPFSDFAKFILAARIIYNRHLREVSVLEGVPMVGNNYLL